jgi:hypothetical protein
MVYLWDVILVRITIETVGGELISERPPTWRPIFSFEPKIGGVGGVRCEIFTPTVAII